MIRPLALVALAVMVAPAFAQDAAMLQHMTGDLDKGDTPKTLRAAYAACMLGAGDLEATAGIFTDAGWAREDDPEMGLTSLAPPGAEPAILMASDGSFCDVATETLGTDTALSTLQILSGVAGVAPESVDVPTGCLAFRLGSTLAEISSTGNDPVCQSETTSAVRFTFE